jgi:hypothetical protein
VGGQRHTPAAIPPRKTRYPLYRRLGGPQSRSGRVRKIPPLPGFDPRTVQSVASRYTDYPGSWTRNEEDNLYVVILIMVAYNADDTTIKSQAQYNKTTEIITCKELYITLDIKNYFTVLYMTYNIRFNMHFKLP